MNWLCQFFYRYVIIFVYSGSLLFFHQAQVVTESGAEGERLGILTNHLG